MDFYIAAFDPAGELIGVRQKKLKNLSEKWLNIASDYLRRHGDSFESNWEGGISHLKTQLTSFEGVALISFFSGGVLAISMVVLCGLSQDAENSVLKMFVNSLRKIDFVRESAANEIPFEDIFSLSKRPLIVVVPWGDSRVLQQDEELLQELSMHLGAAYIFSHLNLDQ